MCPPPPTSSSSIARTLNLVLLGLAAVFLALHAVHLSADFPNQSPWMDWSKYTDEGWYGDAAIRHFQLGHWYVPGDFNPAVALPVLPSLEALLFAFTGVSLVAVRALTVAIFAGILLGSWLLLTRASAPVETDSDRSVESVSSSWPVHSLTASTAVLLLAVSPFCFVFTRLAIIEPLLILLMLFALLAASSLRPTPPAVSALRGNLLPSLALGILLPAMVLTKTTALFLFPAIAWMVFASSGYRLRALLRLGLPIAALAAALWLGYFLLLIRPHYLLDYRYLFSANAYTGMTRENWREVLRNTFTAGDWIGHLLYPLALAAAAWALICLVRLRRLRAHPLIVALLLWIAGYTAFLAYHDNLQPRYYLVIAVPLTLLLPVVFERLVLPLLPGRNPRLRPAALTLAALVAAAIAVPDARLTLHFVRHPEYTLLTAARQVRDYIESAQRTDPTRNPLILSISGSELALMNGLPSICDDFGTLELGDRVKLYHPGWYLAWNQIDDDKMDAMTPLYHPVRVATFPAMDDPDRNVLVLYRLDPATEPTRGRHRRKAIPRALQTKLGEQPSANQLEH